jgi:hypothetical protein
MGNKICGGANDTPLITFSLSCVKEIDSDNINIGALDSPDGQKGKEEEEDETLDVRERRVCCFLQRWQRGKEQKMMMPKKTKSAENDLI